MTHPRKQKHQQKQKQKQKQLRTTRTHRSKRMLSNTPQLDVEHDRLLVTVQNAARMLDVSVRQMYNLLDREPIESRFLGGRRLVVAASLREFAHNLPAHPTAGRWAVGS